MKESDTPASLVTGGATDFAFSGRVLGKYDVKYYRCVETGFIQTEKPYWLDEAYSSAISMLDVGYIYRNVQLAQRLEKLIRQCLPDLRCALDYGGGYGMLVRLMRDRGFPFIRQDPLCENLFAQCFDISDWPNQKYSLVTAFEVFEHLPDPLESVAEMFSYASTIVFSTELQPSGGVTSVDDWWYFIPEVGQHIAFYNDASLRKIAEKFDARVFSAGSLHLMTRESSIPNPFATAAGKVVGRLQRVASRVARIASFRASNNKSKPRESLLQDDFQYVRDLVGRRESGELDQSEDSID